MMSGIVFRLMLQSSAVVRFRPIFDSLFIGVTNSSTLSLISMQMAAGSVSGEDGIEPNLALDGLK